MLVPEPKVIVSESVHPDESEAVTLYVPADREEIMAVEAPVFHK